MLIRPAEPRDAPAVAAVHVRAWQVGYRGLLPDAYLDGLRASDRAARYDFATTDPTKPKTLLACEANAVLGFVTVVPALGDSGEPLGEVAALHVAPEAWGRGIGSALLGAGRARLRALGLHRGFLWVLDGNERADRFYARDGWCADGHTQTDIVWGITVRERRFVRALDDAPA